MDQGAGKDGAAVVVSSGTGPQCFRGPVRAHRPHGLRAGTAWEKWVAKHVGPSGKPVRAALLLNYDPSGPSRLLPIIAEQEGTELKAVDMQPFLDFVKRGNLQMEFFPMGLNQYLVTSIHEHWFCARCINTAKPGGEGVIVMHIGAYLLVSMYDGSVGSASQAMASVDQFSWHFNRRTH